MAGMVYLIIVTQRIVPKIWNPYDILGITEVSNKTVGGAWSKKLGDILFITMRFQH